MTWSYSGDPSSNDIDAVRFEIGDTLFDDPQLQNEEIQHVLNEKGTVLSAALHCCEVLALKYAREADYQLGPLRVYASQRSEAYRALLELLRTRVAGMNVPYVGGLSKEERIADRQDSNLVQPTFKRDLMNNRNGGAILGSSD